MADARLVDIDRLLTVLAGIPHREPRIWTVEPGQSDNKPGMTYAEIIRGRLRLLVKEAELRPDAGIPRWTMGDVLILLVQLTDPGVCSFDHHGYCQAHGHLHESQCPHAKAKRILADFGVTVP